MVGFKTELVSSFLKWKLVWCICIQTVLIQAQTEVKDSCSNFICKWGGMCQIDSFGFPTCVCPLSCPISTGSVCSTYGMEFDSACEMHRFACSHVISIAVANNGKCSKNELSVCPSVSDLLQFRDRYMEWIHIVQSSPKSLNRRVYQLSISEKKNAIKWEFEVHDDDNNGLLNEKEVNVLLEAMQYEPCGFGFVRSCAMVDGKPGISEEEWKICFNLADRPFERRL